MKLKKIREWINLFVVKRPARAILLAILLFNVALIFAAAAIISWLAPQTLAASGFWPSVFYTVSMILDAGCVQYVVADIGETGVMLVVICMLTVLIGMITFTGAVIGYVTNYISSFIESANSGERPLRISGHTVILNWNSRASEIINDLLYTGERETVVVLVSQGAEGVEKEIGDRLGSTRQTEQRYYDEHKVGLSRLERRRLRASLGLDSHLSIIVREGDTFSSKALMDISIDQAKTIVLLGSDVQNGICKYDVEQRTIRAEKGNSNTIKTLVQVAEMTSAESSADDQIIIVEAEDAWTLNLVNRIIAHKERLGKCNIIAVPVNQVLGQILSQFSIMPELNTVYSNLFSYRGAEFFCRSFSEPPSVGEAMMASYYMGEHARAIPLTIMNTKTGCHAFYVAEEENDVYLKEETPVTAGPAVKLNPHYEIGERNVIIIGHNSKSADIMDGFDAFRGEWNHKGGEILNILVIDDKKSLEKRDYYKKYPYVRDVVEAEVFDNERICQEINAFIDANEGDTSILILSDDTVPPEDIDSNALTFLVYVQDIIFRRIAENPDFDRGKVDVVVEILNPKHFDVVHNYSVNNVVISNRYISKMVTQVSRKDALYEFYRDILTYDVNGAGSYESKELYIKPVADFFLEVPAPCTAAELIRSVFDAGPEDNKSVIIGYVRKGQDPVIFTGDQRDIAVALQPGDKLIMFSNH